MIYKKKKNIDKIEKFVSETKNGPMSRVRLSCGLFDRDVFVRFSERRNALWKNPSFSPPVLEKPQF